MKKITLSCLMMLCAIALSAKDYYVTTTGDDNNDGSKETPFASIAKAVATAAAADVVNVAGGEYTGVWGASTNKKLTLTGSWNADFSDRPLVEGGEAWEYQNQTIVNVGGIATLWSTNNSYNSLIEGVRFQGDPTSGPITGSLLDIRNTSIKKCAFVNISIDASKHMINAYSPAGADYTIDECLFEGNGVTGTFTAVLINVSGTLKSSCKVLNSVFRDNLSVQHIVAIPGAEVSPSVVKIAEINNCLFYNNRAKVTLINGNRFTEITNCLVYNNQLNSNTQTFVAASGKIVNSVIANNYNSVNDKGIVLVAQGVVSNTIVFGNTNNVGKTVGFLSDVASEIKNCAFDGDELGGSVIVADNISLSETNPHFINPTSFAGLATTEERKQELAAANWSLKGSSSLIDAGKLELFSATVYGASNEFDFIGNARKFGAEVDMGAHEAIYSTIVATSNDEEKGTVTGGGVYSIGEEATLTAVAIKSFEFQGWYDGVNKLSDSKIYTFTVTPTSNSISYVAKFDTSVSIDEKSLQSALYTSNGQLHISGVDGVLTVFNSIGVKVTQLSVVNSATISLSKDIYIVQIQNAQGVSTAKVVIQ